MSIIKHVTLQKIVAHDFRYDPRRYFTVYLDLQVIPSTINNPTSSLLVPSKRQERRKTFGASQ